MKGKSDEVAADACSGPLKELADRLRRLSYRDLMKFSELLARQGPHMVPAHDVAQFLLAAADDVRPKVGGDVD